MAKFQIPVIKLSTPAGKKLLETIERKRSGRQDAAQKTVQKILADVRKSGDKALFSYTRKFDRVTLTRQTLRVSPAEVTAQAKKVSPSLALAISNAAKRIAAYHRKQKCTGFSMKTFSPLAMA